MNAREFAKVRRTVLAAFNGTASEPELSMYTHSIPTANGPIMFAMSNGGRKYGPAILCRIPPDAAAVLGGNPFSGKYNMALGSAVTADVAAAMMIHHLRRAVNAMGKV